MKPTCSNCRFHLVEPWETPVEAGVNHFCRRYPPPPVNPDGWCGEWVLKSVKKGKVS